MEQRIKNLIIGAGISGLTAANALANEEYLLLEKDNQIGGYCRTIRQGDFIWDYAGHFFHFKTEEMKQLFTQSYAPDEILCREKNTKILYNERLIDYPFQTNIHQLEKQELIDCLVDLFRREEKPLYENFLQMLYGKFGRSIVEKFLKPYNEKLYACPLNQLDPDAMGRFFPYADIPQIIANMRREDNRSYNSSFLYPRSGAGSFLEKLYEKLDPDKVRLNCALTRLDPDKQLAFASDGSVLRYERLISTMPLNHLLALLPGQAAADLQLSYNKVLVFNLGFSKGSERKEHWLYIPDRSVNYYRVGFYNNILGTDKLSLYIEIGFAKDAAVDVPRQLALTLENLHRQGLVAADNPLEESMWVLMDPAYVHINGKTETAIRELKAALAQKGIYPIGRYGGWTYCSMEDCMLEANALIKQ